MKKMMKKLKSSKAFTLLEMVVVLFIVSVLLLLVIPNISSSQDTARETGDEAIIKVVETQRAMYEIDEGSEPTSNQVLVTEGYITQEQLDQYEAAPAE